MILVTGGSGFIGHHFIVEWLSNKQSTVVNLDKITYASCGIFDQALRHHPRYHFCHGDINDRDLVKGLLKQHQPKAIVHFAAESHVDRSLYDPGVFVDTNVKGTWNLLDLSLEYWKNLENREAAKFVFIHISTDEVYGSLKPQEVPFTEASNYAPNSPYAASKAASDHFVRCYHQTFGFPAIITHASNNYGTFQHPEKLIPLMITHALQGQPLPLYGDGLQCRDWLHVKDHCAALRVVMEKGLAGEVYNISSESEYSNLSVVEKICDLLDELIPSKEMPRRRGLIQFVADRLGHDRRYAMSSQKTKSLGWTPELNFEDGLRATVEWYVKHPEWKDQVSEKEYQSWLAKHYL